MVRSVTIGVVILVGTLVSVASGDGTPRFGDYTVRQIFKGKPAEPQFRRGEGQYPNGNDHFRSGVTFDAEGGPNFAGHYTLAIWTCGSGCSGAIVVDALTGRLYRNLPFGMLVLPRLGLGADDPYSFRLDSRLLVVEGYFDIDVPDDRAECSRRYYEWTGSSLKLLKKVLLQCRP